ASLSLVEGAHPSCPFRPSTKILLLMWRGGRIQFRHLHRHRVHTSTPFCRMPRLQPPAHMYHLDGPEQIDCRWHPKFSQAMGMSFPPRFCRIGPDAHPRLDGDFDLSMVHSKVPMIRFDVRKWPTPHPYGHSVCRTRIMNSIFRHPKYAPEMQASKKWVDCTFIFLPQKSI